MKTSRLFLSIVTVTGLAALSLSGCNKGNDASTNMDTVKTDAKNIANDVKTAASDSWDSVKDYTYDKRKEFSDSFDRMTAKLDENARELKSKVAGASDTASNDREKAVKEYDKARADLKSNLSDLGNATADTWADAKEKVAQSWKSVQAAYEKLTSSTAP